MKEVNYKLENENMRFGQELVNPFHIVDIKTQENGCSVTVDSSLVRNPNIMRTYFVENSAKEIREDQEECIRNRACFYAQIMKTLL